MDSSGVVLSTERVSLWTSINTLSNTITTMSTSMASITASVNNISGSVNSLYTLSIQRYYGSVDGSFLRNTIALQLFERPSYNLLMGYVLASITANSLETVPIMTTYRSSTTSRGITYGRYYVYSFISSTGVWSATTLDDTASVVLFYIKEY